jgi:hypothetical protein
MKSRILSQKRKNRREIYDELLFDAMRYLAQAPVVENDILPKLSAALTKFSELESLTRTKPASERTPAWEAEHKKQMKACSKEMDVLLKRWNDLLFPPPDTEPTTRH